MTMITTTTDTATVGRRFAVIGMTCSHCERAVETEIGNLAGVCLVTADASAGTVIVESTEELDVDLVRAAVDEAGYELVR